MICGRMGRNLGNNALLEKNLAVVLTLFKKYRLVINLPFLRLNEAPQYFLSVNTSKGCIYVKKRSFLYRTQFLQVATDFCKLQRTFASCNGLLQVATDFCKLQQTFARRNRLLQVATDFCKLQ
jgi:hypothetical protein